MRRIGSIRLFRQWAPLLAVTCLLLLAGVFSGGCSGKEDAGAKHEAPNAVRIASFSPAMTKIAADMGLGDLIVGRTPWCESVDPDTPVIGDLTTIDFETLLRVRPTHLLIQPQAGGIDAGLRKLIDEHNWAVIERRLNTIDDVIVVVQDIPAAIELAKDRAADVKAESARLADALQGLQTPAADPVWRGRILVVMGSGDGPPLAFGRDTYLDTMLKSLGAANALEQERWVSLSLEDIVRIDPDGIILITAQDGDADPEISVTDPYRSMATTAADAGRIARLSNPQVLFPSTGLLSVDSDLRAILQAWEPVEE